MQWYSNLNLHCGDDYDDDDGGDDDDDDGGGGGGGGDDDDDDDGDDGGGGGDDDDDVDYDHCITITVCSRYHLMLQCWQQVPNKRPTFSMLKNKITNMMQQNDVRYG